MNNIPQYKSGGFLSKLIGRETKLIRKRISESLANKIRKAQKKEGSWRKLQSILKTIATVALPGVGGAITGALIDPIGRNVFGKGAKASDIEATGDENLFGGRKAFKTFRGGLEDAIDAYKQKNITSSIVGFAGSKIGEEALAKWGGGLKDALGFGRGIDDLAASNLEKFGTAGESYSAMPMPPMLEETGGWLDKITESYQYQNPMESMKNILPWWENKLGYQQDGMVQNYEQGGMVQKFQEGGQPNYPAQVERYGWIDYGNDGKKMMGRIYDTYEYDGRNWVITEKGLQWNPGFTVMTQAEVDTYRDEERTETVGSSYMATEGNETKSYAGINDFLRTPAVANLANQAFNGDEDAIDSLVEMARQAIPELANKSTEDLRGEIKKTLTKVDLYGQGYQGVLSGAETTLEGLTGQAQGLRAKKATQEATSGIRTPGTKGTISEGLYEGAEKVYGKMQTDIQGQFDESFEGLETTFLGLGN